MSTSRAKALWKGTIKEGKGNMSFNGYDGSYDFRSRFEGGEGTNPEQLVGAAHAGCFSMYLSLLLSEEGFNPERIHTTADVTIAKDDSGPHITEITLNCQVKCQGLNETKLEDLAAITKEKCPVSRLYAGGTALIQVETKLLN